MESIDLSKVFDTRNHKIFVEKLEMYGVKDRNLHWFESNLSYRKYFLLHNRKRNSYPSVTCEVSQISILGILFLLYINVS